jgi:hypothetical protein
MQKSISYLDALRILICGVAGGLIAHTAPAFAIQCDGNFQIVQGQPVSTPYCRDQYVAVVAREYGIKISPAIIRNNPKQKEEVCRIVGRDIRVQEACAEVLPDGRGRR